MVTKLKQILKTHLKQTALVIAAVLATMLLLVKGCTAPEPPTAPSPLEPGEVMRVEIDGRKLRVTTPKGVVEQFVPDTAKVIVKDGIPSVQVKTAGLKAELGGGFAVTPSRMKLELDTRVAYYRRISLHAGITLDPAADKLINVARPLLFVAYPLMLKWTPNTSVWVGRELPGEWCGGFRVRF